MELTKIYTIDSWHFDYIENEIDSRTANSFNIKGMSYPLFTSFEKARKCCHNDFNGLMSESFHNYAKITELSFVDFSKWRITHEWFYSSDALDSNYFSVLKPLEEDNENPVFSLFAENFVSNGEKQQIVYKKPVTRRKRINNITNQNPGLLDFILCFFDSFQQKMIYAYLNESNEYCEEDSLTVKKFSKMILSFQAIAEQNHLVFQTKQSETKAPDRESGNTSDFFVFVEVPSCNDTIVLSDDCLKKCLSFAQKNCHNQIKVIYFCQEELEKYRELFSEMKLTNCDCLAICYDEIFEDFFTNLFDSEKSSTQCMNNGKFKILKLNNIDDENLDEPNENGIVEFLSPSDLTLSDSFPDSE